MPPRLLIASGIFHPEAGGPATYLYELLPALQTRGWDIQVIAYGNAPASGYPYPLTRIPRRAMPLRLLNYARAARPLLKQADLIYLHTLGLPLTGARAPRVLKIVGDQAWERAIRQRWIPPTTDIDDFQTGDYGVLARLQKLARSRQVRGMDQIIVPSQYLRRMVMGWGVPQDRIQVIYNALPPETHSSALTQAGARSRLGLGGEPLILTAARLYPWKGVDHLIAALAQVPDAHLLVAGDGPMRGPLEQQIEALNLQARVHLLGHVPREQMALYMRAADYFALYSGYEGLSHVLLESLRAGTPVIASDKGGNPEVVTHGINGLLVPYADRDALADMLQEALRPGQREALANQAQVGLERFDFAHMIEQTDAALRAVLNR